MVQVMILIIVIRQAQASDICYRIEFLRLMKRKVTAKQMGRVMLKRGPGSMDLSCLFIQTHEALECRTCTCYDPHIRPHMHQGQKPCVDPDGRPSHRQ